MKFPVLRVLLLLSIIVFTSATRVRLSCGQIRQFVDGHNTRRQRVARGLLAGQPAASSMKFIVWDEELASKAAAWADNVEFAHNSDRTIRSRRWDIVGESIYMAQSYTPPGHRAEPNIEETLHAWFTEYSSYGFEPFSLDLGVGHYTQLVWANTTRMGCGISQKKKEQDWTSTFFVCNYGPAGNYFDQLPYTPYYGPGALRKGLVCAEKDGCKKPYGPRCSKNAKNNFQYQRFRRFF